MCAHCTGRLLAQRGFVLLLVLRRFGSVGLAGNGYTNPAFLLLASMAGWVLVRSAACPDGFPAPRQRRAWLSGPRHDAHCNPAFLSFKLVTWLGLLATGGGELPAGGFPRLFYRRWLVAGLHGRRSGLPLAADAVYKKIKNAVLAH